MPIRKCTGSEQSLRKRNGNFSRTLGIVILRPVHSSTYGIFLHQRGVEGFETAGNGRGIHDSRIEPNVMIVGFQDYRHAIVNIGHRRVRFRSEDGARLDDSPPGSCQRSQSPANANVESSAMPC